MRRTEEFWSEVAALVRHSGKEAANLIRNLMNQYQAVFRSGVSDGFVPKLRNSVELYKVFDQYWQIYYALDEWPGPSANVTESTSCAYESWRLASLSVSVS